MSDKNCLWVVRSAGRAHYLMGTIHLLKKEHYPLAPALEEAFDSAEVIVIEMDGRSLSQEGVGELLAAKGYYSGEQSLQGNVSSETFARLRVLARDLGWDMAALNMAKPWYLELMVTTLKLNKLGFIGAPGVDKYFLKKATDAGKEVIGLETYEEQLDFFDSIPPQNQELGLVEALNSYEKGESKFEGLARAWRAGDVGALEALLLGYGEESPEENESIIIQRNRNWLPRIEAYLQSSTTHLVMIGVGHLVGERGILRALQARGYSVEQL